jgi:hypothetical protein
MPWESSKEEEEEMLRLEKEMLEIVEDEKK